MASLIKDFEEHRLKENFEKELIPETPGIYALYSGYVVVYVGRSTNLKKRIHLRTKSETKIWDRFSWYEVDNEEHYKEIEGLLINVARPIYNKAHAKKKSLGIVKKFLIVVLIALSQILNAQQSIVDKEKDAYVADSTVSFDTGKTVNSVKFFYTNFIFETGKNKKKDNGELIVGVIDQYDNISNNNGDITGAGNTNAPIIDEHVVAVL